MLPLVYVTTMCGRYSTANPKQIKKKFGVKTAPKEFDTPRFNIAPSQKSAVITNTNPNAIELFQWGLIPHWAKDPKIGYKMINARSETIQEKPSFKKPFLKQRCLVPTDGFYEWKTEGKSKQPYRFHLLNDEPFAFAGLWETWKSPDGNLVPTFTIITCASNKTIEPIHNRMPVILPVECFSLWLSNSADATELAKLLVPNSVGGIQTYKISTLINSPVNDVPEVLKPNNEIF